jgi:hypothetical protein
VLASIASFLLLWRLQRNDKRVVAPA